MFDSQDEVKEENEEAPLRCRRPFQPKFIKELNSHSDKGRRSKKKIKEQSISKAKLEKLEKLGMTCERSRSTKRLPETNRAGNRILGVWRNGQLDGQVEIYYSNGVVFKGTYQNGIKVKGHFKFLNGYEYIGHCLGNKFNGEGSLVFPSGKIISGEWKNYALVDKGKIEYPNGEVYYGQIQNLKKHGKGYLFFTDDTKYVGEFKHGLINGFGTYFVNDQPESTGRWVDGQLEESLDISQVQNKEEQFNDINEMCDMIKSSKALISTKKQIKEEFSEEEKQNGKEDEPIQRTPLRKSSRKGSQSVSSKNLSGKQVEKKLRFADANEANEGVSLMDYILEE